MAIRNENPQIQAIKSFWDWFSANVEKLKDLYATNQLEQLSEQVNVRLDKIDPQLAWEMGPGKERANLLTISAEGSPERRRLADLMIRLAPHMEGWEFYSARPSRSAPAVIRLPNSGESFRTAGWEFIPVEHQRTGRLDLVIVDDELAHSDPETALKAVSIFLDELLGEDTVETWIGEFTIGSRVATKGKTTYKMNELPDYLLWAANRKTNPLKRHDVN
jgi:hypothetical protein